MTDIVERLRVVPPSVLAMRDAASEIEYLRARVASPPSGMTEDQIKHMANRFLMWKLPQPLRPDNGISYTPYTKPDDPNYEAHRPSGTNLWGYTDAVEMVRHMLQDLPKAG